MLAIHRIVSRPVLCKNRLTHFVNAISLRRWCLYYAARGLQLGLCLGGILVPAGVSLVEITLHILELFSIHAHGGKLYFQSIEAVQSCRRGDCVACCARRDRAKVIRVPGRDAITTLRL